MDKEAPGTIRAARLDKSKRLQDVFWLLADGREHSTWEVITACKRAAVNSIMAELRAKPNELTVRHRHKDGGNWYRLQRDAKFFEWRRKLQALEEAEAVNG